MATAEQIKSFIREFSALAINECNVRIAAGKPFVLPSVCLAQAALETGWGTSGLMTRANAYFGIKAGGSWTGAVYRADTWEVDSSGSSYNTSANFRAYGSKAESVADYFRLITEASRYSKALSYGSDRSKWLTPRATITAIWQGGYATDNLYVDKIMNTITARNFVQYDAQVTGVGGAAVDFPTDPDFTFSKSDLVQGELVETDSGRSVGNDKTIMTAIALDWEKAPTVKKSVMYTATWSLKHYQQELTPDDFQMSVFTLQGDVPTKIGLTHGGSFTVPAGARFGFYIERSTLVGIMTSDYETIDVKFTDTSGLPDGTEFYDGTLAQFIQI